MGARRIGAATGVLAVAAVTAACSGSSGGAPAATSGRSTVSASYPAASSSAASSRAASGAPGSPAAAAVMQAVRAAYQTFFSSKSTVTQSQGSLQNGARFHAALVQQGKSQYASTSAARVLSVRLLSPNVAAVTYDILSNGQPLLQNAQGHAVQQHGRWVVAAETFCGLMKLQGSTPHACSDPSVTALPSS